MHEIKTEIEIESPAADVWSILTNFEKWAEWNPIVVNAVGTATLGANISITMRGPDDKAAQKYQTKITEYSAPRLFRWEGHMMAGFLFTNTKIFQLDDTANGVRLTHTETFKGLLRPLFWGKISKAVPNMLNSMNEAVKLRAEQSPDQ